MGGTQPPPNWATSVNEWVSPPRLTARTVPPAWTDAHRGENRHDAAPPSARRAKKASNVIPPLRTHAPAPIAALNVGPSQLSSITTIRWRGAPSALDVKARTRMVARLRLESSGRDRMRLPPVVVRPGVNAYRALPVVGLVRSGGLFGDLMHHVPPEADQTNGKGGSLAGPALPVPRVVAG